MNIADLKKASVLDVVVMLLLSGLGFYFAIVLSSTITTTVDALLPKQENPVSSAWINLAVAFFLVLFLVIFLIFIIKWKEGNY